MPRGPRKPKRPTRKGEKPDMEPLFPELRKGAGKRPAKSPEKKKTPQMLAVGRAHQIKRALGELAVRGHIEPGQARVLEGEIRRVLGLYAKGRLTRKEANYFLNSTNWVLEYIKLLKSE